MSGPFKAVTITKFQVHGPDNYRLTMNSINECQMMADKLNEAYEFGLLAGRIESCQDQTHERLIEQLRQDCEDMATSTQTRFTRCEGCGHLHDVGFACCEDKDGAK